MTTALAIPVVTGGVGGVLQPNPRMQPTGRKGAERRPGGALRWCHQRKLRFVRAPA